MKTNNAKNQKKDGFSRRDFIIQTTLRGAALAVGSLSLAAAQTDAFAQRTGTHPLPGYRTMGKRRLGNLEVSELGFGCMNIAWAYSPPTEKKQVVKLIRAAY